MLIILGLILMIEREHGGGERGAMTLNALPGTIF